MTEELKTLKNLKHLVEREEGIPDYEAVDLLTLKAEAIKIHNAGTLEIMEYLEVKDISKREIELLRKFLRKFNNLTESDLEEKN